MRRSSAQVARDIAHTREEFDQEGARRIRAWFTDGKILIENEIIGANSTEYKATLVALMQALVLIEDEDLAKGVEFIAGCNVSDAKQMMSARVPVSAG